MMQQIKSETLRVLFESLSSQDGIAVINPATEQELIRLKPSSLDELDAQIEACKSAQVEWAKLSAKARSASLKVVPIACRAYGRHREHHYLTR